MIYRRPKGGEFKRIKLTSNTNYTDNLSAQPDDLYEYAVAAYYQDTHCESGYASAEGHPELNFVEFNKTIIPQHLDFFIHEGHVILEWEEASVAEGYNVYRNGERIGHNITGNSFVDYTSTSSETYNYTVTGRTAFVESNHSNVVYVDWTTDVNENSADKTISIYPNPTKNTVTVKADGLRQVRVFNVMGQTVICQTALEDNITIDLSAQPQGCYFIETSTAQDSTTTKIVKL